MHRSRIPFVYVLFLFPGKFHQTSVDNYRSNDSNRSSYRSRFFSLKYSTLFGDAFELFIEKNRKPVVHAAVDCKRDTSFWLTSSLTEAQTLVKLVRRSVIRCILTSVFSYFKHFFLPRFTYHNHRVFWAFCVLTLKYSFASIERVPRRSSRKRNLWREEGDGDNRRSCVPRVCVFLSQYKNTVGKYSVISILNKKKEVSFLTFTMLFFSFSPFFFLSVDAPLATSLFLTDSFLIYSRVIRMRVRLRAIHPITGSFLLDDEYSWKYENLCRNLSRKIRNLY